MVLFSILLLHAFLLGHAQVVQGLFESWRIKVEVDFLQLLVITNFFDVIAL
jgi:hypothetical protein